MDNSQVSVTNLEVNTDSLDPMTLRARERFDEMTLYTPWLDRIYMEQVKAENLTTRP